MRKPGSHAVNYLWKQYTSKFIRFKKLGAPIFLWFSKLLLYNLLLLCTLQNLAGISIQRNTPNNLVHFWSTLAIPSSVSSKLRIEILPGFPRFSIKSHSILPLNCLKGIWTSHQQPLISNHKGCIQRQVRATARLNREEKWLNRVREREWEREKG